MPEYPEKIRSENLSDSFTKLGEGIEKAAHNLNPIHPRSSFQASLLIAAVTVGFGAYFYAELISYSQKVFNLVFHIHPYWVSFFSPFLFIAATWLVVRFSPESTGSGIPQVLQAIEETDHQKGQSLMSPLVSVKTALLKVLSSTVGIFAGASIGREGPTVQIASSLFALTARWSRRYFGNPDPQTYIIAGAAAGISAAFNTPLAGITFALEEIAEQSFSKFKRTVMLSVIVGGIVAQAIGGNYLYFGHPFIKDTSLFTILPASVLLGFVGGLFGGLFAKILGKTRFTILPSSWLGKALVCGVVCSVIGLLSNGDTSGSGYEVTKKFMDDPQGALPTLLFPEKFITTVFSYLSGMAGGIFSPCLSIGAGLGCLTGQLLQVSSLKACALIGMVAFFTGAVQAPLTAVIIVMEMTDQSMMIVPFMIAAFLSQVIGHLVMPTPLYRYLAFRRAGNSKS